MPIRNRDDAVEVENRIRRIFSASADERVAAIRALFVEELDFAPASGHVDLTGAPGNAELPSSAQRVAELDGVQVVYVALDTPETSRVRKGEAFAAVKKVSDQLAGDLLLVFTNTSGSQLHLIQPSYEGTRPTLRRMVVERDLPQRTAVQQVSSIYWNHQDSGSIRSALDKAFDVEAVTKAFFQEYKRVFDLAMDSVEGFGKDEEELENKKLFVQTLFNRLMFVYFLSRKGWLAFKGDKDYLAALWRDYGSDSSQTNFYENRLALVFFVGLNNPQSRDLMRDNPVMYGLIGDVPFLNGGLFDKTNLDRVTVPDEAVKPILNDLFDRFNFTVLESTPFDVEVAVDPEMLGKVFEELVTGRHDTGSYYTPRPVVSFMCREALKGYLASCNTGLTSNSITNFVDERDTSGISLASAPKVAEALDAVTVVDPACGSGAYLLGMMQELIDLQTALFNVGVDPKGLYDLKLHIIERNLYGVDIDEFAVNIAMLRLWLSLAIEYEGEHPQPLPNLDFKVLCGDSLLGPDPSAGVEVQGTLGYNVEQVKQLGRLKADYMRASLGPDKERLRKEIQETEAGVREAFGAAGDDQGTLNWRVEFAEVFAQRRGFDIAIANPPYVQLQNNEGLLANKYKDMGYSTLTRTGDVYQLFYERGCQVLKPVDGLLAYITSNSWLKAEYGKSTRRYFSEGHTPLRLLELGKDVFDSAIVDSGVLVLKTGGAGDVFPGVDMESLNVREIPPPEHLWGRVRPEGDAPWSILSALEQSVLYKMRSVGKALAEWDVRINRGILTGYNKAFIIDTATRDALVDTDPKSAEIIKPILKGRAIRRYRAKWEGQWLVATHNGYGDVESININSYPAVKAHLVQFYPQLERRQDRGSTPYNLRHCVYYHEFAKEKLFWIELVDNGRFAYDNSGIYGEATTFVMTGEGLKFLCAVLNSPLIRWFLRQVAPTSGMGTLRWKKVYVETIPIPKIPSDEQRPFIELVDRILDAKDADAGADTSELEAEVDGLVNGLYGLNREEIKAVEGRLG